jgi:hypothetical protein
MDDVRRAPKIPELVSQSFDVPFIPLMLFRLRR